MPNIFMPTSRKIEVDIQPQSQFVVFQGTVLEGATPASLTGQVSVHLNKSTGLRKIKLIFRGIEKIAPNSAQRQPWDDTSKRIVHEQIVDLFNAEEGGPSRTQTFGKGTYLYNFNFTVPPECPESIEGMHIDASAQNNGYCQIVYGLHVQVEKPFAGTTSTQTLATSHIRVIRTIPTLDPQVDLAPDIEPVHESVWNNKISYRVVFPRSRYMYGSTVTAKLEMTPLKKGIKIKTVTMELHEEVSTKSPDQTVSSWSVVPARVVTPFPQDSEYLLPLDSVELVDEAYRFPVTLELPRNLVKCRQSVSSKRCKIFHSLRLTIDILNPEGHTSQLTIRANIRLYISPSLQIHENQEVTIPTAALGSPTSNTHEAPPKYGQHILDMLYEDIDPSGFMTPSVGAGTGFNSPYNGHTENHSFDNLSLLVGDVLSSAHSAADLSSHPHHPRDAITGRAHSEALLSRLENLNVASHRLVRFEGLHEDESNSSGSVPSSPQIPGVGGDEPIGPDSIPPSRSSIDDQSQIRTLGLATERSSEDLHYSMTHSNSLRQRRLSIPDTIQEGSVSVSTTPGEAARESEYDIDALSKTPSYNTAISHPTLFLTPRTDIPGVELPTYDDITSLESSGVRHARTLPSSRTSFTGLSSSSSAHHSTQLLPRSLSSSAVYHALSWPHRSGSTTPDHNQSYSSSTVSTPPGGGSGSRRHFRRSIGSGIVHWHSNHSQTHESGASAAGQQHQSDSGGSNHTLESSVATNPGQANSDATNDTSPSAPPSGTVTPSGRQVHDDSGSGSGSVASPAQSIHRHSSGHGISHAVSRLWAYV